MTMNVEEAEERLIISFLKHFPPSFQFDPTEEEPFEEFLKKKLQTAPFNFNLTNDVPLYDLNPWQFKGKFIINGPNEYFFFTPKDRKYEVGHGAKHVDRIGYWESSGQVLIPIYEINGVEIGSKKVLVYYEGQQPNGNKTPWIMHEYQAKDAKSITVVIQSRTGGYMQLSDWVICKIYKKTEEELAATTAPSATLTAAGENRLNIIESTATRVENTAMIPSREFIEGTGISYDPDTYLFWKSNKCLGNVFKRAEE